MANLIVPKKNARIFSFFAICPGGLDEWLKKEIESLPAKITHHYPGGIEFEGNLETGYLACLKTRIASRILLKINQTKKVFRTEEFYEAVKAVDWTRYFAVEATFAIYVTESKSKDRKNSDHTQFLALKAKDAIADRFREAKGARPSVDREDPDVTIRLHWHDDILKIYLDLSGPSLHERGYRTQTGAAPIKENLAAALLQIAQWPQLAQDGYAFYDPFCGSGTLLIEAAMMASNTAPGLYRQRFGLFTWKDHDPELFDEVLERLRGERILDRSRLPMIAGADQDPKAIEAAQTNIKNAGFDDWIQLSVRPFQETQAPTPRGLIVTNPPYGVRLDELQSLTTLYQQIGSTLKHRFSGWQCGVISSEKKLLHSIGLKPSKKVDLQNGGLESSFFIFHLYDEKISK